MAAESLPCRIESSRFDASKEEKEKSRKAGAPRDSSEKVDWTI
jgi:hypothetical protein